MKATVKVNEQLSVEVEAADTKTLFEQLSRIQEVFQDTKCGACKSQDIRCGVRVVEDNSFYELVCNKCHCKLTYGMKKDGKTIYPKRDEKDSKGKTKVDKDGKPVYLDNNGWIRFVQKEE